MDFLFFCKFNCSYKESEDVPSLIALGTSSLHLVMSPWGLVAQHLRFEDGYRRVVSYTIDDLGKREALLTRFDEYGILKRRLTTGLGGRCLGAGQCPVAPPLAGHGWPIWEKVSIALFFLSFENPWRLLAGWWNGENILARLLLGWNYGARGHICCDPPMRVSPDAGKTGQDGLAFLVAL